eukprot:6470455-Amphidinium_carterae.1
MFTLSSTPANAIRRYRCVWAWTPTRHVLASAIAGYLALPSVKTSPPNMPVATSALSHGRQDTPIGSLLGCKPVFRYTSSFRVSTNALC